MVYERPGRGHSSPGYSYSGRNYHREKTPEEKEQERVKEQKRQEQEALEQTALQSTLKMSGSAEKLVTGRVVKQRRVWHEFLQLVSEKYGTKVASRVATTVSNGEVSISDLVNKEVPQDIAVAIYQDWDSLWSESVNNVSVSDEAEVNQVFQAGIPTAIVGTYGTTLGTKVIWRTFGAVIAQRFGAVAVKALGLSAADGLLPVGEAVAAGLLMATAIKIAKNWDKLWAETEKILVQQEREPQIYTTPIDEQVDTQRTTGHAPPKVETGTPGIDTQSAPRTPNNTQHGEIEKSVASDYVMESRWSSSYHYQKNAPQVNYKNEVHHLITNAEGKKSELTQEAYDRGIWSSDRTTNLIRLPSTQAAFQQSPIKIKHRGSHKKWSEHAAEVLEDAEIDLELQYGTIDNVPDAVLQQTLDQIETDLKNDLLDINQGLQKKWIENQPDGTQRLSREENGAVIA